LCEPARSEVAVEARDLPVDHVVQFGDESVDRRARNELVVGPAVAGPLPAPVVAELAVRHANHSQQLAIYTAMVGGVSVYGHHSEIMRLGLAGSAGVGYYKSL
jgi:hypothetical protein